MIIKFKLYFNGFKPGLTEQKIIYVHMWSLCIMLFGDCQMARGW